MPITRVECLDFSTFKLLNVKFSSGINVFVGANGTGKTNLMKLVYAACDITKSKLNFAEKLIRVYLPSGRVLGRLVRRKRGRNDCYIHVTRQDGEKSVRLSASFASNHERAESASIRGIKSWSENPITSVFIPAKEMLSAAPGFLALYAQRELHFDETYADILNRALTPPLRGPMDHLRKRLMLTLQDAIEGKVTIKKDEFFLANKQGNLEFSLLAEGMRKLGLLWVLIQNGTLLNGSILFWDEPEANLNPSLYGTLMDIVLQLQRMGVQIFLSTHDYVILKELDLRKRPTDKILFHSLYRDNLGSVDHKASDDYLGMHPNAIDEAFGSLYDREIQRSLGSGSK